MIAWYDKEFRSIVGTQEMQEMDRELEERYYLHMVGVDLDNKMKTLVYAERERRIAEQGLGGSAYSNDEWESTFNREEEES